MREKPGAVILSAVFLTTLIVGIFSIKMQAQSRRVPEVDSPKTTTAPAASPPASSPQTWEYRILRGPVSKPTYANAGPTLEPQIREFAEQGYEIQSFNVVSPACGGASRDLAFEAEAIVLLRRMKK